MIARLIVWSARNLVLVLFAASLASAAGIYAVRTLPLDAIVLETDAPDIPPAWLAGGRNSPDQLPGIALAMAALRGLAVEDLAAATSANANAVLPRLARLH